ncbi:MAG: N-acetyltransferase, partial [Chitinophagaceae bacterium]
MRAFRTDSTHDDFKALVTALDADLAIRDGDQTIFYSQFNKIDTIKNAIVIYEDDKPAACGAIKAYEAHCMEVKRMYTIPEFRGRGLASAVISELEKWAI